MSNYFAAKKDKAELGNALMSKVSGFNRMSKALGLNQKLQKAWATYHGMFWNSFGGSHEISFTGEQGEITQLPVNHIRNLTTHTKNMILASRPALDARAANTDPKSLIQAQLGTSLIDYYMREKRLEKYLAGAVESAIVLGAGYLSILWDTSEGAIIDEDEETGLTVREGDIKCNNYTPFEIIFDLNKNNADHDWLITTDFKNRYDLMAKYPDMAEIIEGLPGKDKLENCVIIDKDMASDEVPLFTFYHKPSDALPNGRMVIFLSADCVLVDLDLPYKKIPVYRITPGDVIGTSVGYGATFDLIPLQDAVNTLYTSVFSNNVALGTQNLFVKTGANLTNSQLTGGLNIIEGLEKPEPLNLVASSPETYNLIKVIEGLMETLSGINSTIRGEPEANLRSASALAVVQSMAIQYINGLQQQYVQLLEDAGTAIVETLKSYATEPRVVSIIGKNKKAYLKQFKADDIQEVNRVVVDVSNPLSKTTAGRIQMAEQLMQMKADQFTIEQYIQVINTGKIETMTSKETRKTNQIEMENERLMSGSPTKVLILDDHATHIIEHTSLLDDPDIRDDDTSSQVILDHIQQHMDMAQDPNMQALHALLGHKQVAPPPPPQQGQPNQAPPQGNANASDIAQQPDQGQMPPTQEPNLPASPDGRPTTPDQAMQQGGYVA